MVELYSLASHTAFAVALRAMLRLAQRSREQSALGSLVRAQTRSSLIICATAASRRRRSRGKSLRLRQKVKIRQARMSMPYFWRRWRDLNSRADCSTYTLSRGASSPLEYISKAGGELLAIILYQAKVRLSRDLVKKLERFIANSFSRGRPPSFSRFLCIPSATFLFRA